MNLQVLRLVALLGLLSFGAALASSQTVAELAKQSESQQRQAIMGNVDSATKSLMSKTDRGGKPKSAQDIEENRAMANMVQALFTQDAAHPSEEPLGTKTILMRIKKGAAANPNQTLTEVMTGLVDPAFDHFYTSSLNANSKAIWATKSDADQVKLFRLSIEMLQNERLYQQTIKALKDEDAKLGKQMQQMRDETAHYDPQAENGERNAPPPPAASPAPVTPAPPPPAAAPSSPPASSTADGPMGGGGFITPPTTFNALLCVSADLANNSSWSNPEGGSKMDTFKYRVASYIKSVAKPGWEYWIAPGQYDRFDPATNLSGGQFVSAVSPDSGRFDEFDPRCPSGYAAFWVKVQH